MTLAALAAAVGDPDEYAARIWKLLAFLGRYGHQPAPAALRLPMRDVSILAQSVGQLIEEESEAGRRAMEE